MGIDSEFDLMFSLTTYGVKPGAAVRSVGAVLFDRVKGQFGDGFYANVTDESCEKLLLYKNPVILGWWRERSPEVQAYLLSDQKPIETVATDFAAFIASHSPRAVWPNNVEYDDAAIFEEIWRRLKLSCPWDFRKIRSANTIFELTGVDPDWTRDSYYDALSTTRVLAQAVINGYRRLRL